MKEPRVLRFELFGAENQKRVDVKLPRDGKIIKVAMTLHNPFIWVLYDHVIMGNDIRKFVVMPTDTQLSGKEGTECHFIDTFFNQSEVSFQRGKYYPTEMHLFEITEEPCT